MSRALRSHAFTRLGLVIWSLSRIGIAQATTGEVASPAPLGAASSDSNPRLKGPALAEYPAGAQDRAEVQLELVIASTGEVREATILDGTEPFAEAARRAARTWQFEPAMRNGKAVSSRIRFLLTFTEPDPTPDGEEANAPSSESLPTRGELSEPKGGRSEPRPGDVPIDVTVAGTRPDRSISLGRAEIRQLPGAFGDPFRAVEALPGVVPVASGLPYFYIRGAPPGNSGYFFDGVRVPFLFHAGAGPSVIHPSLVDDVKLHPGAYPARYGRFSGGIVAADAVPRATRLRAEANVRLVDAGAMVAVPFAGGRGDVTLAGRYSYTAAIMSLLVPTLDLGYWDYQARANYDLTSEDRVGILAFGAFDFAAQEDQNNTKATAYEVRFHRMDFRYDRRLSSRGRLRLAATLGDDRTVGAGSAYTVRSASRGVRAEYTQRVGDDIEVRAGGDLYFDRYRLNTAPMAGRSTNTPLDDLTQDIPRWVQSHHDTLAGARMDVVWNSGSFLTLVPGVRFDVYHSQGVWAHALEPRISARFRVRDDVVLFQDFGIAHQLPSYVVPIPGLQPSLGSGLQLALQSSAGVEVKLPQDFTGSVTLFQNGLFNTSDTLGVGAFPSSDAPQVRDPRSMGRAAGAELLLKRKLTRRLSGFMAYTLSRSQRSFGQASGPASVDRTHVLNLAVGYDLGRGWRIGARTVYYTGIPAKVAYLEAARHPPRTPPFYRFDWRVEKRWTIGDSGAWWALVVEVLNTTLNKEVLGMSCAAFGCKQNVFGPVTIPSIGVEAAY